MYKRQDYTSVNGQLNYLRYELVNKYPTVYKYMLNVSDTEDGAYNAGYYWCYNFEIPANTEKTSIIRGNLAKNEYWPKYASSVLTPSLSSVTNTINGILVKWNAVANADGYRVYRRTNGGDWERIAIIKDGGTIEYSDTSVKSGTKYTYTIRASLGDTLSNYNSGLGILYLKTPDVAASAAAGGIKVTWEKITGADGYRVYRKTKGGGWTRVADIKGGSIVTYTDKSVSNSSTYTYTVRANSGSTLSDYQPGASVSYLKAPDVAGVSKVSGGVKVTWGKITGADGYRVYRRTNGGDWVRIADLKGGSTVTYMDESVSSGSKYTYTVRAYSGSTLSGYESGKSIIYLKDPNVTGVSAVCGGAKVTWEKITGADGYRVYRRTNGGGWIRIADLKGGSTVTYTDDSVSSGSKYTYTVRAYLGSTLSGYESGESILYLKDPNVTGVSAVSDGVKVAWEKITGAEGYYVYRRTNGGNWERIVAIRSGYMVTYTDKSATSGSTYTYTVRAYSGSTLSAYQSGAKILYLKDPNVTGASAISGGVGVTWEKISGATGYRVYRRTNGSDWTRIADIKSGSTVAYVDTSVTSGSTYTYTVRACSGNTLSCYKSQKKVIYLSVPALSGAEEAGGNINVTWKKVNGASGYYIYRKTNGGGWSRIGTVKGGSTLRYADTSVSQGAIYTYTVRAYNGSSLSYYETDGVSH